MQPVKCSLIISAPRLFLHVTKFGHVSLLSDTCTLWGFVAFCDCERRHGWTYLFVPVMTSTSLYLSRCLSRVSLARQGCQRPRRVVGVGVLMQNLQNNSSPLSPHFRMSTQKRRLWVDSSLMDADGSKKSEKGLTCAALQHLISECNFRAPHLLPPFFPFLCHRKCG